VPWYDVTHGGRGWMAGRAGAAVSRALLAGLGLTRRPTAATEATGRGVRELFTASSPRRPGRVAADFAGSEACVEPVAVMR